VSIQTLRFPYFAGPAVPREGSDGTILSRAMLDRCPGGRRGWNGAPPPTQETRLFYLGHKPLITLHF